MPCSLVVAVNASHYSLIYDDLHIQGLSLIPFLAVLWCASATTGFLLRRSTISSNTARVRLADLLVARTRIQAVVFPSSLPLGSRLGFFGARLVGVEGRIRMGCLVVRAGL